MQAQKLGFVYQRLIVDRIVYATITLMSVLIIYDGWQHLRLSDVAGIIIGPVVAMFLAHVFSAAMAQQVARGTWTGESGPQSCGPRHPSCCCVSRPCCSWWS